MDGSQNANTHTDDGLGSAGVAGCCAAGSELVPDGSRVWGRSRLQYGFAESAVVLELR